jgi:hypothetical protein
MRQKLKQLSINKKHANRETTSLIFFGFIWNVNLIQPAVRARPLVEARRPSRNYRINFALFSSASSSSPSSEECRTGSFRNWFLNAFLMAVDWPDSRIRIVSVKPQRNRLPDMVKQLLQNLKVPNPLKGLRTGGSTLLMGLWQGRDRVSEDDAEDTFLIKPDSFHSAFPSAKQVEYEIGPIEDTNTLNGIFVM